MSRLTATMALVGAALTAASGCMTVSGEPSPSGSASRPSPPSPASRTAPESGPAEEDGSRDQQTVPSPGRRAGTPPAPRGGQGSPLPSGGGSGRTPGASTDSPSRPRQQPAPQQEEEPAHREPGPYPEPPHQRPSAEDRNGWEDRRHHPRHHAGLCELGRKYGRWEPDNKEDRACRTKYGG